MSIPVSEKPLLKGNTLTFTAVGDYQELLKVEVDPNIHGFYVDSIGIDISDVTTQPMINVRLNGTPYLEDFPIINTSIKFGFGRHWKVIKHQIPIHVAIKPTAIGGMGGLTPTPLRVTAYVSGLQDF